MLERIAHAKINLALHITGQRDDGYHLIDSLVVFTQYGDVISVSETKDSSSLVSLTIDGPFAETLEIGANNLVSRAALALGYEVTKAHGKPKPVQIKLTKNLPIASGIGGGSADAAATLLALQAFWGSEIELEAIALKLGADVPMCLYSKPLRAQGIGDELSLLESKSPFYIVLVNPLKQVSTPAIFKKLVKKDNAPIYTEAIIKCPELSSMQSMRNDLQQHAVELEPAIQSVIECLNKTDASLVRMSGSGATCFGMFDTKQSADEALNQIKSQNSNWWCIATTTTVS